MGDYLDLVMRFILAFGISFLLPVLMLLLNRAGIITREQFTRSRRFVIVGIFVVAAVATPPDVVSQLILAIPLMILFEGSLLLMPRAKKDDDKGEEPKADALPAPAEQAGGSEAAPTPPVV
jgi:sec-independent protein translocase protein TatC